MIHVGGKRERNEFALSGDAVMDAFVSVALARKMKGGVVMSSQGWNSIRGSVLRGKSFDDGFAQVDASYGVQGRKNAINQLERHFLKLDNETLEELELEHSLTYYIPDPVAQCFSKVRTNMSCGVTKYVVFEREAREFQSTHFHVSITILKF